ncbi:MAG TPA: hypothetical protein VF913_06700 [Xanthobacteraceae bacterium]
MTSSNPFEAFGEANAHRVKPRRVTEKQKARQEAALRERDQLFRAHERRRKDEIAALLAGPYGAAAAALVEFLDHMNEAATGLIELVRSGPWRDADEDTRFLVILLIDRALVRSRERRGLPSFDDPMPDEEPDAFLQLREFLR